MSKGLLPAYRSDNRRYVNSAEVASMKETPRLAGGRLPVLVHLLAPNGRPAQVTMDLASFWASTWQEVRKDLRGRYPKHSWPEDPSEAVAEDRPRRKARKPR
jgi:ATP-dependent helicase HrpB